MKIADIIKKLEILAPPEYTLDWDNSGLQAGNPDTPLKKTGIALTPTVEIVKEAVNKGCNLLITHHPLIFKAIKSINTTTPLGKMLELALKNDLAIYTMHTNFDSASSGLNYQIAKDLGLDNIGVLSVTKSIKMLKLVTFVPEEYTLKVINAISEAGAGHIGKFTHCSYITAGIATYVNEDDSEGLKIEELTAPNKEPEDRLEIMVPENNLKRVIATLKEVHPYKDFLYDIYNIENKGEKVGIGTIGEFYTSFSLSEVIEIVKRNLRLNSLCYVGSTDKQISKVAVCTGSGSSFMFEAKKKGADLFITGDIKYHSAIDAQEIDLAMIDAGHYGTEIIAVPFIAKYLKQEFPENNLEIEELIEADPFATA